MAFVRDRAYLLVFRTEPIRGQTSRPFQTRYKEHITAITKLQNSSTYAEHITNANHTYRDINTDMEILHIQPKSQKLKHTRKYEIYRHTKTHPNDILNTQLNFKTHTLFDSTLRTHPHRKQEAQDQQRPVLKMTENRSKHVNKLFVVILLVHWSSVISALYSLSVIFFDLEAKDKRLLTDVRRNRIRTYEFNGTCATSEVNLRRDEQKVPGMSEDWSRETSVMSS
ncbi:hypothetical protein ANN_11930 [Periplaneta americana]|uniref:Uncharacterized protein n=1 Tax=Periplaneta americana TaxID=6978 RepID=A0ABQ8T6E4_PERAM|nr:hypothetical protein ANN_11930 [Periplaneta americana]